MSQNFAASYTVTGMTCDHCAASVREELGELPGVRQVEVDAASGLVTVTSDTELAESAVRNAVEEAGYRLADA